MQDHGLACFDIYDALIMCCNILFGGNAAPDWPWLTWLSYFIKREGANAHDSVFWPWISIYDAI
jgi:hypothetical protein